MRSGGNRSGGFGFVDGTVRPICRTGENQRLVYNGHIKRVHALKFQAVALHNGLIGRLFGPMGKTSYSYKVSFVLVLSHRFWLRKIYQ